MIAFIDESYDTRHDGTILAVVGGIVIDEYRYRALETGIHHLKARLVRELYEADGLTEAELERRATDLEIKGADCLKQKLFADPARENASKPRSALEALRVTTRCKGRFVVATAELPHVKMIHGDDEQLPRHYVDLLRQIKQASGNRDRPVILAFDSVHGRVDRAFARRVSGFLYRSPQSKGMKHFVPVPFCIASDTTAGSQVADVVCRVELLRQIGKPDTLRGIASHLAELETGRVLKVGGRA